MMHKLTITKNENNPNFVRGICSCGKWRSGRPLSEMAAAHKSHVNPRQAKETQGTYRDFVAGFKRLGKAEKDIPSEDQWVYHGKPTIDEWCRKIFGRSFEEILKLIQTKKLEAAAENPYKKTTSGEVSPVVRRRLLTSTSARVKLLRIGELSAGLEIPFIRLWNSRPDQTTTIEEMAKIFVEAKATMRLATAKNMIRRALSRGDAVKVE